MRGVRYVSQPLGYANERARHLTPHAPSLKLVWDVDGPPPMPEAPLVRYWEEHGGCEPSLDVLLAYRQPSPPARSTNMRRIRTWNAFERKAVEL
jgi:hypothetical protein